MSMTPLPHRYQVNATAAPNGDVLLLGDGVRALRSQPPETFGGPGDRWSPETLLVGAIADCFALTFRAVARAAHLQWESLECEADGVLDRLNGDRVPQFTGFRLRAYLRVVSGTSEAEAQRVLARARANCLVTYSLKAPCDFDAHVEVAAASEVA